GHRTQPLTPRDKLGDAHPPTNAVRQRLQAARTAVRTGSRAVPYGFRPGGWMAHRGRHAATATYRGSSDAGPWWARADHCRPTADLGTTSGTTQCTSRIDLQARCCAWFNCLMSVKNRALTRSLPSHWVRVTSCSPRPTARRWPGPAWCRGIAQDSPWVV